MQNGIFFLAIDLGDDAFNPNAEQKPSAEAARPEISRVLRELAERVDAGIVVLQSEQLTGVRDTNGNTVGHCGVLDTTDPDWPLGVQQVLQAITVGSIG